MKNNIWFVFILSLFINCKNKNSEIDEKFEFLGEKITVDGAISKEAMLAKYKILKNEDTLNVKFKAKIVSVCQAKGCWMNLELSKTETAFVKFKDYGFFIPLNGKYSDAIVAGKAFVSVETVDQLRHYAKDEGKSQAAIDSIVAAKTTYSIVDHGVLINN